MTYKGYEIRPNISTKFKIEEGEEIEIQCWGIFRNGDFRGSVQTADAAKAFIDDLTAESLYRPIEPRTKVKRSEFDEIKFIMETNWRERVGDPA